MARYKIYKTVQEMEIKINEYFEKCDREGKQYRITSLCVHLGIVRDTLSQYEKLEEFSDTIKLAKQKVEAGYEDKLDNRDFATAGVIFALKNFNWKDKQDIEMNATIKKLEDLID